MEEKLKNLKQSALSVIKALKNQAELEMAEIKYLGRKSGELTELMKCLKDLSVEEKKTVGQLANEVKREIEDLLARKKAELSQVQWVGALEKEKVDITQPALPVKEQGHFHPNTLVQKELEDLFSTMGFMILDGPELESDYYNFTALNVPPAHPARDTQDTFYIKGHPDWVMRTQTSPVQVRAMKKYGAPLRMIAPGRCFRNEATDSRHEHTFYQLEGIIIDKNISFSHLKGVLEAVVKHLYGSKTAMRLRPKFFPFVEPGVNGEVTCFLCGGKGCQLCKKSGWLEIFGAGLIHPSVLKEGGIDSRKYSGLAFGFGLTRLAMLKYGIEDVRWLESGDLRFLKQF